MSPEFAREWIRKAEADRKAARRALQDSKKDPDQAEIACFHAQQCAEKYLKALLADAGSPVPRIHDLLALARLQKERRLRAPRLEERLRSLNQYAVEIRYPGNSATPAEAHRAIRSMEEIVRSSRRLFKTAR